MQSDLEQYIQHLKNHDWWYDYTEDFSVWMGGRKSWELLTDRQELLDPDFKLWNQYAPDEMKRNVE